MVAADGEWLVAKRLSVDQVLRRFNAQVSGKCGEGVGIVTVAEPPALEQESGAG